MQKYARWHIPFSLSLCCSKGWRCAHRDHCNGPYRGKMTHILIIIHRCCYYFTMVALARCPVEHGRVTWSGYYCRIRYDRWSALEPNIVWWRRSNITASNKKKKKKSKTCTIIIAYIVAGGWAIAETEIETQLDASLGFTSLTEWRCDNEAGKRRGQSNREVMIIMISYKNRKRNQ